MDPWGDTLCSDFRFARIPVCGVNQNLAWGKLKIRFCGGGGNEERESSSPLTQIPV